MTVWIDDAHWAADALGFCEFLKKRHSAAPMLVVLTCRDDVLAEHVDVEANFVLARVFNDTLINDKIVNTIRSEVATIGLYIVFDKPQISLK